MSAQKLRMNLDRLGIFVIVMVLAIFGLAVRLRSAQDDHGAGIVFSKRAGAADVGLPIYPGAKPYKDPSGDRDARLGAWGGGFGFRVAVVQLESGDGPSKIARYYKKALAKYGPVLDCTKGGATHADSSHALTCDVEHAKDSEIVIEAGTKENERIVEVDAKGSGSTFALVYLWTEGE
ncbi:MAG: hypothetical protein ACRD5K_18690 [Candidatus Acidiferrales bacterium]